MSLIADLAAAYKWAAEAESGFARTGHYYIGSIMSNRTITAVAMITATQAAVTLNDGTKYETGGYPSIGGTPEAPNYGVALRDPSSTTGAFISETPALTYDVALEFQKLGINDAEVLATIARGPQSAPAVADASPGAASPEPIEVTAEESATPSTGSEPAAVIPAHAGHATILRQFADKIERGVKVVLSEIVTELHKLV